MPKAVPKSAAHRVKGVEVAPPANLRGRLDLWHKRINLMSGGMVLIRNGSGIPRDTLRGWIMELRLMADEMEKHLG